MTTTRTPTTGAADLRTTFSEILVDLPNTEPYTLFKAGFDAALAAGQATAAPAQPAPATQQAGEVVAHRVMRNSLYSGWVCDGRYWSDGPPSKELVESICADKKRWRVDVAYATPQAAESVQEDAARLDFLIEQRAYVVSDPDACPGHWLHWAMPDGRTWVQGDEHPTPRAAIDAARKQGARWQSAVRALTLHI